MGFNTFLLYVVSVLVLTATPGPSILLCITKSVSHGFRASVFAALGSLSAIVGIMTLSFTGLGVLIASSEVAFNIVKMLGAAYLIYLGLRLLFSRSSQISSEISLDISSDINMGSAQKPTNQIPRLSLFSSGFLVGATNPKAIVFFTALFPQFINLHDALLPQYCLLVTTFSVLELGWLIIYAYFGAKSSSWLLADGRATVFNKVTGGVFISAGVFLSTSKNVG